MFCTLFTFYVKIWNYSWNMHIYSSESFSCIFPANQIVCIFYLHGAATLKKNMQMHNNLDSTCKQIVQVRHIYKMRIYRGDDVGWGCGERVLSSGSIVHNVRTTDTLVARRSGRTSTFPRQAIWRPPWAVRTKSSNVVVLDRCRYASVDFTRAVRVLS